jgi:hypothetical protein
VRAAGGQGPRGEELERRSSEKLGKGGRVTIGREGVRVWVCDAVLDLSLDLLHAQQPHMQRRAENATIVSAIVTGEPSLSACHLSAVQVCLSVNQSGSRCASARERHPHSGWWPMPAYSIDSAICSIAASRQIDWLGIHYQYEYSGGGGNLG